MTDLTAVLDVDGVCGDYLPWLFEFLARRTGGNVDQQSWQLVKDLQKVHEAAGLELYWYQRFKEEYRAGAKWNMPAVEGMPGVTHALKRNGFRVVIATTRGAHYTERTRDWLNRNDFVFDTLAAVGQGDMGKARRVSEVAGLKPNDEGVIWVDDAFSGVLTAGRMGWQGVLRNFRHNTWDDPQRLRSGWEKRYSFRRYDTAGQLMDIMLEHKEGLL